MLLPAKCVFVLVCVSINNAVQFLVADDAFFSVFMDDDNFLDDVRNVHTLLVFKVLSG